MIETPATIEVAALNRKHPDYDGSLWREWELFYEGGSTLCKAARNPSDYGLDRGQEILFKRYKESDALYADRLRRMYTLGYLGGIVEMFSAIIFSDPPSIEAKGADQTEQDWYASFADDVDGKGSKLGIFLSKLFADLVVMQKAYILVDFPQRPDGAVVETREHEDELDLRHARWIRIRRPQVYDFGRDDRDRMEWAVVHSKSKPRASLSAERDVTLHEWRVCQRGHMAIYEYEHKGKGDIPKNAKALRRSEIKLRYQDFPLVEAEIPIGLHIGGKVHPAEKELLQKQNALSWAEYMTAYAMLVAKLSDPTVIDKEVGDGIAKVIGENDDMAWLEAGGAACEVLSNTLKRLKQEIFRVAAQLPLAASNENMGTAESGEAKARDRDPMNRVCMFYGNTLLDTTAQALHVTANGRSNSGKDDKAEFGRSGLQEFDNRRIRELIELFSDGTIDKLKSPTATVAARKEIVRTTLKLSPEELEQAYAEIEKAAEEGDDEKLKLLMASLRGAMVGGADDEDEDEAGDGDQDDAA